MFQTTNQKKSNKMTQGKSINTYETLKRVTKCFHLSSFPCAVLYQIGPLDRPHSRSHSKSPETFLKGDGSHAHSKIYVVNPCVYIYIYRLNEVLSGDSGNSS